MRMVSENTDADARLPAIPNDGGDCGPEAVGDLLATWLSIQMDSVDDLVDEARHKVASIPSWKNVVELVGELVVRVHCLEQDLADHRRGHR
jgi:hypothetical protein